MKKPHYFHKYLKRRLKELRIFSAGQKIRRNAQCPRIFQDHHAVLITRTIYEANKRNLALTIQILHQKIVKDWNINCSETSLRVFLRAI